MRTPPQPVLFLRKRGAAGRHGCGPAVKPSSPSRWAGVAHVAVPTIPSASGARSCTLSAPLERSTSFSIFSRKGSMRRGRRR